MNKTFFPKQKDIHPQWFIIDGQGQTLGRISTKIARTLLGKDSMMYTPGCNLQQKVIVINAEMIAVTGKKKMCKFYYRHTGRPGGLSIKTFKEVKKSSPLRIIEQAVRRMLPKNSYGREIFTNLKIYRDSHHPYNNNKIKVITT